jgi:hypothetical protein
VEKKKEKHNFITCRTSTRVRRDECVVDVRSCVFRVSSEIVHSLKKEKNNPISRVTLNYVTLSSNQFPFNVVRT